MFSIIEKVICGILERTVVCHGCRYRVTFVIFFSHSKK